MRDAQGPQAGVRIPAAVVSEAATAACIMTTTAASDDLDGHRRPDSVVYLESSSSTKQRVAGGEIEDIKLDRFGPGALRSASRGCHAVGERQQTILQ